MLNRMHYDIQGYFRAYYRELRKQITERDPDFQVLPHWFKGGRRIHAQGCADGVMVVHRPYDEESHTFPDREDSFEFFLTPDDLVKDAVARMIAPRPGGQIDINLLDYEINQGFGSLVYTEPLRLEHPLIDDQVLVEEVRWTRLDVTDMDNLDTWRDKAEARRDARQVLSEYLNLLEAIPRSL